MVLTPVSKDTEIRTTVSPFSHSTLGLYLRPYGAYIVLMRARTGIHPQSNLEFQGSRRLWHHPQHAV